MRKSLLTLLVFSILLPPLATAEENILTERTSLRVEFFKHKDDEFVGQGDVDNRWEIFEPEITVDPPLSLGDSPGNELILILLGEYTYRSEDKWKVFLYKKLEMDLKKGEKFHWKGEQVKIEYDPRSPSESYAYQYDGYVILIKNAEGEVVYTKASKNKWLKKIDRTLAVSEGSVYTEDYFKGKADQ
jgi:hypothetical protein